MVFLFKQHKFKRLKNMLEKLKCKRKLNAYRYSNDFIKGTEHRRVSSIVVNY